MSLSIVENNCSEFSLFCIDKYIYLRKSERSLFRREIGNMEKKVLIIFTTNHNSKYSELIWIQDNLKVMDTNNAFPFRSYSDDFLWDNCRVINALKNYYLNYY